MDAQGRLRYILYGAVVILAIIAATQPTTSHVAMVAILAPALFVAIGVFLLGGPFLAMEHAEAHKVRWRKAVDILEHSGVLSWLDLMVLWAVAFVAGMGFADMSMGVRAAFVVVTATGAFAALGDWFLAQERDARQAKWQHHPGS